MDNKSCLFIIKKTIQKELISEMYNKGIIDFVNANNIKKEIDKDINHFKKIEEKNKELSNITLKIPI